MEKSKKMTHQEFRKKVIKTYPLLLRICIFLGISDIKIIDNNVWRTSDDYNYKILKINLYNPLSYVLLIFFIPIGLILNGFNKESFRDIKRLFEYR